MPGKPSTRDASPDGSAAELPSLRFGLRRFLVFVTVFCLLLAVLATVNWQVRIALLGSLVVIGGHVLATMLGSRLRAAADDRDINSSKYSPRRKPWVEES